MQLDGKISDICNLEPLDKKWEAFNWNVINVKNGNDCDEIDKAIIKAKSLYMLEKPTMIILNTIKGKGISFAENAGVSNHSMQITPEMMEQGLKELGGEI